MPNRKTLAVIPARAGSKRLKNKNILDLSGKPLIAWTIDAALKSKNIDEIFVSTDSEDVKKVADKMGVCPPIMRPVELASDTATSLSVVQHAVTYFESLGRVFTEVILLQPTSPLRSTKDIDEALRFYFESNADAVTSVTQCEHSPLWSNTLPEDRNMDSFLDESLKNKRSQELPDYYRLNGAIYIAKIKQGASSVEFFPKTNKFAYVMPQERSIDIDTGLDLMIAQAILDQNDGLVNGLDNN